MADTTNTIRTIGRRKTAAARIRLSKGKGAITINEKDVDVFFPIAYWKGKVVSPLEAVGKANDFDISIRVAGGGVNAQAEAVRHGISRALVEFDEGLKPVLKSLGFLTRDSRARERKKFGRHRARRGHQWRKR